MVTDTSRHIVPHASMCVGSWSSADARSGTWRSLCTHPSLGSEVLDSLSSDNKAYEYAINDFEYATPNCLGSGNYKESLRTLISAQYLIQRPWRDARLSWPRWLASIRYGCLSKIQRNFTFLLSACTAFSGIWLLWQILRLCVIILPDFIRDPSISTDSFRRLLKTYLFARY